MKPLRVLIIEDDEDDAMLLLRELRHGGYEPLSERVETRESMRKALRDSEWDIVFSDYVMPKFSGEAALEILKESGLDLPFIIVSGNIGEHVAVNAMKAGAHDYIIKGNMKRLVPAVERELQERKVRNERRRAEAALRESQINKEELERLVRRRTKDLVRTISGLQTEVANRIRVEEALRSSEMNLAKAQAITHIGSWHYDVKTKKVTCSDELYRIFGIDPAGFDGDLESIIPKRVHPDDQEKAQKGVRQIVTTAKGEPVEYRILLPNGEQRVVRAEAEAVYNESGQRVSFIGVVQDITERKRAQEEIIRLATAVESAADAVVITERGMIRYVNPAFEKMTGYAREEVQDRDLHMLDSGRYDEVFYETMREAVRKEGVWTGRLINKKKDGTLYEEECTYAPVRDATGEILNYMSIKRDVTEKVRLESIAQAVDTMNNIGYIFSGVRHEIGNPINTISMSLNLLMKKIEEFDKKTIGRYVRRSLDELEKVEYLLRTLKNFNMYEQLEPQEISMTGFIDKLLALIQEDFEKKGILVSARVETEASRLYADPRALQQVLLNLITNASDALNGRQNPKIMVSAAGAGKMVRVRVEDNGSGIPEEKLRDVFKPFFTTKAHGTGLGLVIVRKMIAKMNGTMEITSQAGKGTAVDILIPRGNEGK